MRKHEARKEMRLAKAREQFFSPLDGLFQNVFSNLSFSACCRKRGPLRKRLESVRTIQDAVWLLQSISAECATTDKICALIVSSYRNAPPTELEMRRLSLMFQATENGADVEAFAALTLWLCAIESFCSPFSPAPTAVRAGSRSLSSNVPLGKGGPLTAVSSMTRLMELSDSQPASRFTAAGHMRTNHTLPSRLDDLGRPSAGTMSGWRRGEQLEQERLRVESESLSDLSESLSGRRSDGARPSV